MKKVLIVLMLLLIPFTSFSQVAFGEAAEELTYETDCPTGYTGSSKCVVYQLKDYQQKETVQEAKGVENKELKQTSSGKKIFNHPFAWFAGSAIGYAASKSETFKKAEVAFWDNVNEVDLFLGGIADNMVESSAEAFQDAWDYAQENKQTYLDLPAKVWDDLYDAFLTMAGEETWFDEDFANEMNDKFKFAYRDDQRINSIIDDALARHGAPAQVADVYDVYNGDLKISTTVALISKSNQYLAMVYIYRPVYVEFQNSVSLGWKDTWAEARKLIQERKDKANTNPTDGTKDKIGFDNGIDRPVAMGNLNPIIPGAVLVGMPKISELPDGKKVIEVESPYPNMPDFYPYPYQPSSPGFPEDEVAYPRIPDTSKVIIEADTGKIINTEGLPVGEPISPPISNPLPNPLNPPVPGGPGGDGGINPNNPDGPKVPSKPPPIGGNPLPLILIFAEFLLACIMYVIRLGAFILTIPDVPKRQFPGVVGEYFNYFQHFEIGNIHPYYIFLGVINLLFGLMVYKVLRRVFNG